MGGAFCLPAVYQRLPGFLFACSVRDARFDADLAARAPGLYEKSVQQVQVWPDLGGVMIIGHLPVAQARCSTQHRFSVPAKPDRDWLLDRQRVNARIRDSVPFAFEVY